MSVDLENVTESVFSSFMSVWEGFLGHIPYIAASLVVLILFWIAARFSVAIVERALKRASMRRSLKDLALRFVSLGVWTLGLLLAAMILFPGLTPSKALGALGLVSIAVGLAFKDIFENFFAGILLLWRFPFENGDFIECQGVVGQVEDIRIRMTTLRKTTGELTVVPNSFLFKNPVDVLTDQRLRRVTLMVGVAYESDVGEAVKVIEQSLKNCETVSDKISTEVFTAAFGASSIDIEVAWWTDSKPLDLRRSRAEVVQAIKRSFEEAGIGIPFPCRTLYFNEPLVLEQTGD